MFKFTKKKKKKKSLTLHLLEHDWEEEVSGGHVILSLMLQGGKLHEPLFTQRKFLYWSHVIFLKEKEIIIKKVFQYHCQTQLPLELPLKSKWDLTAPKV